MRTEKHITESLMTIEKTTSNTGAIWYSAPGFAAFTQLEARWFALSEKLGTMVEVAPGKFYIKALQS